MNRALATITFLLSIFIFAGNSPAFCRQQNAGTDTVEAKIKSGLSDHYKKYPQEKIFLHTDKSVYVSGQTLWYKAYTIAYGKPSELSRVMYVQLTDNKGSILVKSKLPVKDGTAHGNFNLPTGLPSGWYLLRAYTAWMMNFGEEGFYHQKIYIQNQLDTTSRVADRPGKKYHINFFPEGGDLVEGYICNIAFKATDEDGVPVKINGEVLDNNKKVLTKLVTVHDGMGVFELEGYAGKKNTAIVHFPDNTAQTIELPAVKKTGVLMQVNNQHDNEVELKIAFNGNLQQYRDVVIAAFQNNGLINTYPLQLANGINVFSIKKSDFSTGILRLTLFDQQGVPQAERIVFINKHDQLKLVLDADTLSFRPKSKNVFKLNTVDGQGKPVAGNFSVSVTDADAIADVPDNDNIYSSLLLTSELKGRIYNPAWYFKNNSDTLQKQLDLVMLTNGWRHFKWDAVLNNTPVALKYPVERSQYIAGKIIGYHQPASDKDQLKIKLIIANEDSTKYVGYITPDKTGSFILRDYEHAGVARMYLEVVDARNRKQSVAVQFIKTMMDTVQIPRDTVTSFPKTNPAVNTELLNDEQKMQLSANGIVLESIEIKGKKTNPTDLVIKDHVHNFITDNIYTLDLVNNPFPDIGIIAYIQGKFPGLQIYGNTFLYHGGNSLGYGVQNTTPARPNDPPVSGAFQPYFYLNESRVTFADLQEIQLNDIALIRFAPPPVWFAPYNGGNVGALLIYSKKAGDDIETFKKEAFDHYIFNGYSMTREFYSPDYSGIRTNFSPDNRSTLYWKYNLDIDNTGQVKFHFYNSDKPKKFRVIIQGIDANGQVGYLNEVF